MITWSYFQKYDQIFLYFSTTYEDLEKKTAHEEFLRPARQQNHHNW